MYNSGMVGFDYAPNLEAWRNELEAGLHGPDGLLALSGLYWLEPGINTVGSSPDCTICLPRPVPRLLGALERVGDAVIFRADVGQSVEAGGAHGLVSVELRVEGSDAPSVFRAGGLTMGLIRHAGRVGLQVWDPARAERAALPRRQWFDVDPDLRIRGAYNGYLAPVRARFMDSLGAVIEGYVQGYLAVKVAGKSYRLDATETPDGRLFLQFRDLTNGVETFEAGRYLVTEPVSEDGSVYVDFNRACNPPSAFTPFSPCTFPPKTSLIGQAIAAGEKTPAEHVPPL